MLNRAKLIQELHYISHKLYYDISSQLSLAHAIWQQLILDHDFIKKIIQTSTNYLLPSWQNNLADIVKISPIKDYSVIAVDGSQIYPDRHQGTDCFLINIGLIHLQYSSLHSQVFFDSQPHVLLASDDAITTEEVNCIRQNYEIKVSVDYIKNNKNLLSQLVLFDGALGYWTLEKQSKQRSFFLNNYFNYMSELYKNNQLLAAYISNPRHKELSNIIRLALPHIDLPYSTQPATVDNIIDTHIVQFFLPYAHRTTIFYQSDNIVESYPKVLQPCFFYLNAGSEIVRIEIPYWLAQQQEYVNLVAAILLDQATKGLGYPISLAEAHEQAVIKNNDREFFYYLIKKSSLSNKQTLVMSPKSIKKRNIGV